MRLRPMLQVHDVVASSGWYQAVIGLTSGHGALVERARSAGARIAEEPHWNPVAHHNEATLVDPDGYVVILHSPFEPGA